MIETKVIYALLFLVYLRLGRTQSTNLSCDIRPGQANTTDKLQRLRAHLINNNLLGYVIFSEDEHQSEYVQPYDERRAWISGFTGSAGTAVVTRDQAALWTDGRYFTQAEGELDCRNWSLMRSGQPGVPSLSSWIASQVTATSPSKQIGVTAQFVSSNWWSSVSGVLSARNGTLTEVTDLIGLVWDSSNGRPPAASNTVQVHELRFTGTPWGEKVKTVARLVQERKANAFLVTALDDVAWLFSVRGSDIPYNPFFKVRRRGACPVQESLFDSLGLCDGLCRSDCPIVDE